MAEITYQMVLSTLQTVGLLVGIAYYVMTLRNQNKARQAPLFLQMYSKFQDPEFLTVYNEIMTREFDDAYDYYTKYGGREDLNKSMIVMNWFEAFGGLMKKGFIDADLVYEIIPTNAFSYWDKYKDVVKMAREKGNYPQLMKPVEYLADEMKKIAKSRGDPININPDSVYKPE